jgi:hypothetical protein
MAVSKQRKQEAQAKIAVALEKHGRGYNFAPIWREYPEVPETTFYRWVRVIDASGLPSDRAMKKARRTIRQREKAAGSKTAVQGALVEAVAEELPAVPDERNFSSMSVPKLLDRLEACISLAEELKEHARSATGGVRNAKLLLQASEHARRTADTISKLYAMLWDVQRTEALHQTIFKRLRERDPELVLLILQDLERINHDFRIEGAA